MFNKKILSLLLLSFLCFGIIASTLPTSFAVVSLVANNEGSGNSELAALHPSGSSLTSAVTQTFKINTNCYITGISIQAYKYAGAPNFKVKMEVLSAPAANSVYGACTLIEESSTTLEASSTTGSYAWYTFAFSGTHQLTAGSYYMLRFWVSEATLIGSTNDIRIAYVSSGAYTDGQTSSYYSNVYNMWASADINFRVYADTTAPPTASPTPAPSTYLWWNGTAWVSYTPATPEPNIFDNGVATPYIQMLVPIIILAAAALLGWKFAGAWGFFAGLNIGAILTYMILGSSVFPLWGIVALLVIDGLLLFGKIGIRS